jgi:hypothetical protein
LWDFCICNVVNTDYSKPGNTVLWSKWKWSHLDQHGDLINLPFSLRTKGRGNGGGCCDSYIMIPNLDSIFILQRQHRNRRHSIIALYRVRPANFLFHMAFHIQKRKLTCHTLYYALLDTSTTFSSSTNFWRFLYFTNHAVQDTM